MSATVSFDSARVPTASVAIPQRIAGYAGLAFAILVALVNVLIGASAPPSFDAPSSEIVAWVTGNRASMLSAISVVPFGVILLYAFVSGASARLSQGSAEASFWTRFGGIGIVLIEVLFLARVLFEMVLVSNVERLTNEPALVEILWQAQGAAMIMTGLAIGIALTGLSRAARLSGLIPAWQQGMAFGAALAFLVAAVTAVPSLEGSPVGMLGLPAFITWLAWLAITSVRLLKDSNAPA